MDDRREEEGGEAAAAAMLREVPKPNVDGEARWIRKAGQLRFGYKRHTVTDPNGMILAEETTAANASDTRHFEGPLRRAGLPRGHPHLRRQGLRLGGESGGGPAHGVQGPHHAPGGPREGAPGARAAAQRGDQPGEVPG